MTNALSPRYYQFPGGIEAKAITGHLTGFGAQAVQYGIRSCRVDGNNKGANIDELIEDLHKGIRFYELEIARLSTDLPPTTAEQTTPPRGGPEIENMDLPFTDDDLGVCCDASGVLGLSLERTITLAAAAWSRQLLDAHHYPQAN